jgi:hypothetical protein
MRLRRAGPRVASSDRRWGLPSGIEFDAAEIASGTTKTTASIALDLEDSYFHFNAIRQSGRA